MKTKILALSIMIALWVGVSAQNYYNMQYTWQEIEAAITALRDTIPGQIAGKLDNGVRNIQIDANSGVNILVDMPISNAPEGSEHGYMFAMDGYSVLRLASATADGDTITGGYVSINTETPDPGYALTVSGYAIADRWDVAGADFAEYFATQTTWPIGVAVVIDHEQIREAMAGEYPIGITSAGAGFVGNTGRPASPIAISAVGDTLYEDVQYVLVERVIPHTGITKTAWVPASKVKELPENPKLKTIREAVKNPDYAKEYVQRRNDPNYQLVGLIGQIPLRKNQTPNPNWIYIRELDKECDLWLVK